LKAKEIEQIKTFLRDIDHGKAPGLELPDAVRERLEEAAATEPDDAIYCQKIGCEALATWQGQDGLVWCRDHPELYLVWRDRYYQLAQGVMAAKTAPTLQECRAALDTALALGKIRQG